MFKIILSNTKDIIPVKSIEEIKRILERINTGDNIIICSNGVLNPSYLVAILEYKEAGKDEAYLSQIGYKSEKDSEFAKLLSPKMKMLSNKNRTEAQEETATEERRLRK